MVDNIKNARLKVNNLKIRKQIFEEQLVETKKDLMISQIDYERHLKARAIVQIVAEETQKKIEYQISNLVSMALASVFPDPYEFKASFVQRRNKTECDLLFIKNGNETDDILNSGGGGVADIASFALRIALWCIKKTRPTFLLDEPGKFIHNAEYQGKVSEMIKKLSRELKIQIIIISDLPFITKSADKVFVVENKKGTAFIKEMQ